MIKVNPQWVPKEPFYVCVSSGIDSIAAAHWLKHHYHKKFTIIHFNHSVQPINDKMEELVTQFCEDFNIIDYVVVTRKDVYNDELSEDGLRQFRLRNMNDLGGKFVTGHHLNDCVENYLANCFKGCPEYKPIKEFSQFDGFSIYHPFLGTTKQEFINYAKANDLMKYVVEDPTNKEVSQKRNWLRNVIIPELNERELGIETVVRKKFYS